MVRGTELLHFFARVNAGDRATIVHLFAGREHLYEVETTMHKPAYKSCCECGSTAGRPPIRFSTISVWVKRKNDVISALEAQAPLRARHGIPEGSLTAKLGALSKSAFQNLLLEFESKVRHKLHSSRAISA